MRWNNLQLQVINSPFDEEQVKLLNQILPRLTEGQKIWLNGYLSASPTGSFPIEEISGDEVQAITNSAITATKEVTVLFGSQTGNSQSIAKKFAKNLQADNFEVTLVSMSDFKLNSLKKLQHLLIVVSTQGEGDPPDNAIQLHEFLASKRAPKLDNLQFSILSLGDSSYEKFCQTGKEFDERLAALGATRIAPRVDCDLDFDDAADNWLTDVQGKLNELITGSSSASVKLHQDTEIVTEEFIYSRKNPFQAQVLENLNLNGRGSNKETQHLELSLENADLQFEPGDSLGIYPKNNEALVAALIAELGWDEEEQIQMKDSPAQSLKDALISNFEITVLSKPLLTKLASFTSSSQLHDLLQVENTQQLREYLYGRDLLDVAQDFKPWTISASEFISTLRKIPARLYSIASSQKANPDEVHLTIGTVRYEVNGREREGVFSGACADQVEVGDTLPVYVHHNPNFKLPQNSETPIIMIGAGTGVAPYRAFLEGREELGAGGKSWLFFGDQHFVTDFLYQTEWQRWLKVGVLTRMDVAFSRDTEQKVYVQHRLKERAEEIYKWIENGAVIYICGDEKHMATDVHATLLKIIEEQGRKTSEEAVAYIQNLQQQKRYQRDVY